ncbi:hypothetical protein [Eubacterium sp. AF17-7]|nr:hypothetical protein [Eubacterium sp. AF17-7]
MVAKIPIKLGRRKWIDLLQLGKTSGEKMYLASRINITAEGEI